MKFKHSDAVTVVEQELNRYGIKTTQLNSSRTGLDILAKFPNGLEQKIIVRIISSVGGYTYVIRDKFDTKDLNLVLAVLFRRDSQENEIYLFPASAWNKGKYPFVYYPYNKPDQVSNPEYGITFSQKTLELINEYSLPIYTNTICS